jgi:hypothetical protein
MENTKILIVQGRGRCQLVRAEAVIRAGSESAASSRLLCSQSRARDFLPDVESVLLFLDDRQAQRIGDDVGGSAA